MRTTKHAVTLSAEERAQLRTLVGRGVAPARRLGDRATMEREVAAWARRRNEVARTVDRHFTADDARIGPKRLYPTHGD